MVNPAGSIANARVSARTGLQEADAGQPAKTNEEQLIQGHAEQNTGPVEYGDHKPSSESPAPSTFGINTATALPAWHSTNPTKAETFRGGNGFSPSHKAY